MGSGTLTSSADGDIIPASDHNQLVNALLEEIVPRDTTKAPVDEGGQLGTSLYRFLYAYVTNYFIGTAANNLKIYEGATGEIWIERGGTSGETLKLKNGTIEFWDGGSVFLSIDSSGVNTEKFFDYNSLKTRASKIQYDESTTSNTGTGSYASINSATINGCLSGKTILIDFNLSGWSHSGAGSGTVDWRIKVNGSVEYNFVDTLTFRRLIRKYTIPSDGNYTVTVEAQELDNTGSTLLIQEV